MIGQQFSGSIMSIVWIKHGTKICSKEPFVSEKQCDKSWTSRQSNLKLWAWTVHAVINGLHWISIKHKLYGTLDRKRNYPSDKCSWKDNHKLKRSVNKFWLIKHKVLGLLDILICSLFNSKRDNSKTVKFQNAANWEHGPILKQAKRILNSNTAEPHLRNHLIYSDRNDNFYSNFHCFSIQWDYSFSQKWTRKTFSVFLGWHQIYSLV